MSEIEYFYRYIQYFIYNINNECGKSILISKSIPSYIHVKLTTFRYDFIRTKENQFKKYGLDYYFVGNNKVELSYSYGNKSKDNTIHVYYKQTNIDKLVKAKEYMGDKLFKVGLKSIKSRNFFFE